MVAIDGSDALAFVIIRPDSTEGSVSIKSGAQAMSRQAAAYVLHQVADLFEAEAGR
ncbi:hypothetical protein AB0A98_06205 [Streptomyces chrestomyceticus]|uniref:hypothetical protein n=1 Tax=Streptomyces chrestomyceticus TaxID=68185 RepID=UPI003402081F